MGCATFPDISASNSYRNLPKRYLFKALNVQEMKAWPHILPLAKSWLSSPLDLPQQVSASLTIPSAAAVAVEGKEYLVDEAVGFGFTFSVCEGI